MATTVQPRPRAGELVEAEPQSKRSKRREYDAFAIHIIAELKRRGMTRAELAYLADVDERWLGAVLGGRAPGRRIAPKLIAYIGSPADEMVR